MTAERAGHSLRSAAALAIWLAACEPPERPPASPAAGGPIRLVDATASAGIDFVHAHCGTGKRYMPETMGSGAAWFDYDGDGWSDLYLVNGAPTPGYTGRTPADALYRNQGDGTFGDVTVAAGAENPGYGMGVTAGDIDNDGDTDLYLTNLAEDVLLRNDGDGTFTDVTRQAGVSDPFWSTSAAFGDIDGDGDLDLYAVNYVDFTWATHKVCGEPRLGFEAYCHPDVYDGVADSLYLNDGDGSFDPVGGERLAMDPRRWESDGKGLGVAFLDVDLDGDEDIFVANDSVPNFLWVNRGDGFFDEEAVVRGIAFNADGKTEACMGVALGDLDTDGVEEVFVTNLDTETNTLYATLPGGFFRDVTRESGLGPPSYLNVGFGTAFADLDHDGLLDLFVANGHIIDNIQLRRPEMTHAQPNLLFRGLGGWRFEDVSVAGGEAVTRPAVGRGLATADFDGDGDQDLALAENDAPARLLRNDLPGNGRRSWLQARLVSPSGHREAIGARLVVEAGGRRQGRVRRSASSYLSQSESVLHVGLGDERRAERVEVTWPGGGRSRWLDVPGERRLVLWGPGPAAEGR